MPYIPLKKYLNKFILAILISCMSFLFMINAWCNPNNVYVLKPSWMKLRGPAKDLRYIKGSDLVSIRANTVFVDENNYPLPEGDYYFIQVKNPPKNIPVPDRTIFFVPCLEGIARTAHGYLAEHIVKLEIKLGRINEQLNSGGELKVDEEGRLKSWTVKTCTYFHYLKLDTDPDTPTRVGLPRETYSEA